MTHRSENMQELIHRGVEALQNFEADPESVVDNDRIVLCMMIRAVETELRDRQRQKLSERRNYQPTPEDEKRILAAYRAGKSVESIAASSPCSRLKTRAIIDRAAQDDPGLKAEHVENVKRICAEKIRAEFTRRRAAGLLKPKRQPAAIRHQEFLAQRAKERQKLDATAGELKGRTAIERQLFGLTIRR